MANEPNRTIHDKKLQGYPHADQVEQIEDHIRKEKVTDAKYSQGHFLRELVDDFFAAREETPGSNGSELVESIEELRVTVNHLKDSQTESIRRDIAEFMKVILLNHRELFGKSKLTEQQVQALLTQMFSSN